MAAERYKQLSVEHVKNKDASKAINFSFPFRITKLLGEVFMGNVCIEFAEFLSDAFGVDKKHLDAGKTSKKTSKFEACLVSITSSTNDLLINKSGIVAKRILNELVEQNPGIIYQSNSHRNKKTHAVDDSTLIELVDTCVLKSVMDKIFFEMVRKAAPSVILTEIPTKEQIFKRYGSLTVMEYSNHTFMYSRHAMFDYKVKVFENLNIAGDSDIAKSNMEFIEKLFDQYEMFVFHVIVSKSLNKMFIFYNRKEVGEMFEKIFTMCECMICGETNVIRHNTVPIKSGDMCIICAKQAQAAREISFERLNQVSCFSGDCGENPTLFYVFHRGVYIADRENRPLNVLDASMWEFRGIMFMQYLNDVVHPKFKELVEVKPQALPDADTVAIVYDAIVDRLDLILSSVTEYIDDIVATNVPADDFLVPIWNLKDRVLRFKDDFTSDKSPEHILEKSKYTGELIRKFGYVYYPRITDVNSHFQFDQFIEKVNESAPLGITITQKMTDLMAKIIKTLEEVRCYCFCDFCKNFMMKIDACDTGTCTNCSHAFCMEHGTTLSNDHVYCDFIHGSGSKCTAFYHVTAGGFRWDNIPAKLEATCECKLSINHEKHSDA